MGTGGYKYKLGGYAKEDMAHLTSGGTLAFHYLDGWKSTPRDGAFTSIPRESCSKVAT